MGVIEMCDEREFLDRSRSGRLESEMVRLAALGFMTSGVVHDFRNLMQVVNSAINLIEQKLDQRTLASVAPYINGALQSVGRADVLSRQLLGVARKEDAYAEAVNLEFVLSAMELPISWTVGPEIEVELHLEKNLPAVFCSAQEFESVVLNLVINAKDAMPRGGTLRVSVQKSDFGSGPTVVVRVTDTGCGMSAETVKHAFQPLFTTKPAGRGTGLGLAMVSDFMLRTGGSAQIESVANYGTSIILRFPACHDQRM